jgi:transcriptional regulator with XRE-family HTH domain
MNRADAEEYTQSLGQIAAGSYRQIVLASRLGVPEALGLTTADWVKDRIGGYIRMSKPDRTEAVLELTAEGMSTREIAEALGVDHGTVARDLRDVANATDETKDGNDSGAGPDGTVANATDDTIEINPRKASEDRRAAILEAPVDPEILPGILMSLYLFEKDPDSPHRLMDTRRHHLRPRKEVHPELPF